MARHYEDEGKILCGVSNTVAIAAMAMEGQRGPPTVPASDLLAGAAEVHPGDCPGCREAFPRLLRSDYELPAKIPDGKAQPYELGRSPDDPGHFHVMRRVGNSTDPEDAPIEGKALWLGIGWCGRVRYDQITTSSAPIVIGLGPKPGGICPECVDAVRAARSKRATQQASEGLDVKPRRVYFKEGVTDLKFRGVEIDPSFVVKESGYYLVGMRDGKPFVEGPVAPLGAGAPDASNTLREAPAGERVARGLAELLRIWPELDERLVYLLPGAPRLIKQAIDLLAPLKTLHPYVDARDDLEVRQVSEEDSFKGRSIVLAYTAPHGGAGIYLTPDDATRLATHLLREVVRAQDKE